MRLLTDYLGRQVRLTDERLIHILERLEMNDREADLRRTLSEPEIVRKSRIDETALLSYRYYTGTVVGDKWLCVVVKYLAEDAFVLTAYFTDRPKQGEQVWTQP